MEDFFVVRKKISGFSHSLGSKPTYILGDLDKMEFEIRDVPLADISAAGSISKAVSG